MKRLFLALALALCSGVALAAINLNTATKDELVALPGIGPAKAQAIVDYRNQHGPFRSVDDVRKVKGIGEKLFLQIRPELTLTGGPPMIQLQTSTLCRCCSTIWSPQIQRFEYQLRCCHSNSPHFGFLPPRCWMTGLPTQ